MKPTAALLVPALALLATTALRAEGKPDQDVRRSVVRVLATQHLPSLLKPWQKRSPADVAGTGVVIDGKRVLTNAHLVRYARPVYVQTPQDRPVPARPVEAKGARHRRQGREQARAVPRQGSGRIRRRAARRTSDPSRGRIRGVAG